MFVPERRIFRDTAVKQYIERHQQEVLPHLVSPSGMFFIWILLALIVIGGIIIWSIPVPMHITAMGIVSEQQNQLDNSPVVFVFVSANQQSIIQPGQPVRMQVSNTNLVFQGTVTQIKPDLSNTTNLRQQYGLNENFLSGVTQPLVTLTVRSHTRFSLPINAGKALTATITVGSQTVLSLFL